MKWTETDADAQRLGEMSKQLWDAFLTGRTWITIELRSGRWVRGRFSGTHAENNAGRGGRWQYAAAITLQDNQGAKEEVDILDIKFFSSATEDKGAH